MRGHKAEQLGIATVSFFGFLMWFMSDLFQRKGWTPLPFIAKELPYAPRLHWLGIALILIMLSMIGLTVAGLYGFLPLSIAVLGRSVSLYLSAPAALSPWFRYSFRTAPVLPPASSVGSQPSAASPIR